MPQFPLNWAMSMSLKDQGRERILNNLKRKDGRGKVKKDLCMQIATAGVTNSLEMGMTEMLLRNCKEVGPGLC
jgi:hypothetical protein